jgi:photosystem II stability/assembly factor-like uncharacterized protein
MDLLRAGRLDVSGLFTHRLALAGVNSAVDLIDQRRGSPIFITIAPTARGEVVVADQQRTLYIGTNVGLFAARPGTNGAYDLEPRGLSGQMVGAILVDRDDSRRLYAGTRTDGVYRSDDGGATWREASKGIVYREIWSLAQAANGDLYAGTQPPAIYKSTDRGETWVGCPSFQEMEESLFWTFPRAPHIAHIKALHARPDDANWVYGAVEEGWIVRTTDGGRTWQTLKQGVAFDSHAVTTVPGRPEVVIATSGGGVFRSDNHGETWQKSDAGIQGGFTGGGYMSPPAVHPDRPSVVFAAAAEVPPPFWFTRPQGANAFFYRSDDGGRTWRKLEGSGLPEGGLQPAPRSCIVDSRNPDGVYFGMTDGSVYATEDGGASFRKIVEGLPGWIAALQVAYPSSSPASTAPTVEQSTPAVNGANGAAAHADGQPAEIGQTYQITIAREIDAPVIGANGVTRIGDADVRIPGARTGEKYTVRVLALGTNPYTQRTEATIQKVSGPE